MRSAIRIFLWYATLAGGACCADLSGQVTLQLQPGATATTLAGSGADGLAVAGVALASPLGSPRGIAYDPGGNLLVADARSHVVMKITSAGALTIVAGDGQQGYGGDGGAATAAELNAPSAVVADAGGNLYIADTGNHCIRKVSASGMISTLAGNGVPGTAGDGGPAIAAQLRQPRGLALDASGTLYIADTGNHRVRQLRADGTIQAVAGTGEEGDDGDAGAALAATLREPVGLACTADGGLLITDSSARRLRLVAASGIISAYAANMRRPEGVTVDGSGTVSVADAGNQWLLQLAADGASHAAGSGEQGVFAAGAPLASPLDSPSSVASGSNGDLVLSDRRNHQVQRIALPRLDFGTVALGGSSAAQIVTLRNAGETQLQVLALSVPVGFGSIAASSTCGSAPFTLQPSGACAVAIAFAPTTLGVQSGLAQIRITGAAPQSFVLAGTGASSTTLASSTTVLSSNGTVSYVGAPVGLTAVVTSTQSTVATGTVSLYDNAALLTMATLSSGSATMATASLTLGQHTLHATYSGDRIYAASTSGTVTESIVAAPDFTVSGVSASYSGNAGSALLVGMVLTPLNGTLNHTVAFSVTGLPNGATYSLSPAAAVLATNPLPITLTIQMPVVLSLLRRPEIPIVATCIACLGVWPRRRVVAWLCVLIVAALCTGGCGGFRGTAASIGTAGGPGNGSGGVFNYTAIITATTTGVLGDALTHSVTAGLVVTQ